MARHCSAHTKRMGNSFMTDISTVRPKDATSKRPALQRKGRATVFEPVVLSLCEMVGREYIESVCAARAFLSGESEAELLRLAEGKVEFYPHAFHERLVSLLPSVGSACCRPVAQSALGATSIAFQANSKRGLAPQSALGYLRIGEDGRLHLTSKSEHYHTPLGHGFPGYKLIERARRLGIPNATHNSTRGHITRLVEEELVCRAGGVASGDSTSRARLLASHDPARLTRVLNLETGSLAAEAALKMVLARFYKPQAAAQEPKYWGRLPVVVVMGDDKGGLEANYHGTTMLAQIMRGMWPELLTALEHDGAVFVRSLRRNRVDELERLFEVYEKPPYKIAGVFHELLMMNYAAHLLSDDFVQRLYSLCKEHDVPTVVDEIQTCVWSPEVFMFREYGVEPSIIVLGKGFPGGECAASRILFTPALDNLPQFGALVTNGQEELASLAYLVTLRWAEANAEATRTIGEYYQERLNDLAAAHPRLIASIEGRRHLAGLYFVGIEPAKVFVTRLQQAGLDISVQAYKTGCPPCALTKLPLTIGYEAVDFIIERMDSALKGL